jgi:hypothetical protein
MTPLELEDIATELREGRPAPTEDFAAELDKWAAEGFPSGAEARESAPGRLQRPRPDRERRFRLGTRLGGLKPAIAPLVATLLILAIPVTAVLVGGRGDMDDGDGGGSGLGSGGGEEALRAEPEGDRLSGPSGGASEGQGAELRQGRGSNALVPLSRSTAGVRQDRFKERTAQMTLGADSDEVPRVADDVDEITLRYGGIVDEMSVSTNDQGEARANLLLRIPERSLPAALSEIADLAHVETRNEAALDVTKEFVTAEERFADGRAEVDALLRALGQADDPNEIASIRERLRVARANLARARAQLRDVKQRANFSRVKVAVVSESGGWSLGDAADDAVDVLEAIGGAGLITLAVAVPLGAAGAALWFGSAGLRRRRRERVLDGE